MYKKLIFVFLIIFVFVMFLSSTDAKQEEVVFWEFQSIDTMKYSRDLAREKMNDKSFDFVIDNQVKQIAQTGATHVAIATPYDEEFIPYLKRWVDAARRNNVNVWYRGNFAGWEKWFNYEPIDRKTHIEKTKLFIQKHHELFEDGDIFTPCPECENGGPGDPRHNGDVKGHREFLIEEYVVSKKAFAKLNKQVQTNFASMNGDVAKLVMNKETTAQMGGVVVIDHYVSSPEKLLSDIKDLAKQTGGQIVLGEFGVPILDINGHMTEEEQSEWLKSAFEKLIETEELVGVNYWVNVGGSTELWNGKGAARKAVGVVQEAYSPKQIIGVVINELGSPIGNAIVSSDTRRYISRKDGYFFIPTINKQEKVRIIAEGYKPIGGNIMPESLTTITLIKENETIFYKIGKVLRKIIPHPQ